MSDPGLPLAALKLALADYETRAKAARREEARLVDLIRGSGSSPGDRVNRADYQARRSEERGKAETAEELAGVMLAAIDELEARLAAIPRIEARIVTVAQSGERTDTWEEVQLDRWVNGHPVVLLQNGREALEACDWRIAS